MDLALLMYVELDTLCIMTLAFLAIKSVKQLERRESWRFFRAATVFAILAIGADLFWALIEHDVIRFTPMLAFLTNAAYYLASTLVTVSWFYYTEAEMDTGYLRDKRLILLAAMPMLVLLALLVATYFNGCMFYFDADGIFRRGPLNLLSFLMPLFCLFASAAHAFSLALRRENYAHRKTYVSLGLFALIAISFCLLQIPLPGTPLPSIGITIGIQLVFYDTQERLVSMDPLTKMNNRGQMIRYLTDKLAHADGKPPLYLVLVDIDAFKQINDTYGHVEGDRALIRMADVLKLTAAAFGCFASRYGGDEFLLLHEAQDEEEMRTLCAFIEQKLDQSNRAAQTPYTLRVSIGYARYTGESRYIPDFIAQADEALYRVKREHSAQHAG